MQGFLVLFHFLLGVQSAHNDAGARRPVRGHRRVLVSSGTFSVQRVCVVDRYLLKPIIDQKVGVRCFAVRLRILRIVLRIFGSCLTFGRDRDLAGNVGHVARWLRLKRASHGVGEQHRFLFCKALRWTVVAIAFHLTGAKESVTPHGSVLVWRRVLKGKHVHALRAPCGGIRAESLAVHVRLGEAG